MNDDHIYTLHYREGGIYDAGQARIFEFLLSAAPHRSDVYTWDDLGVANIICDAFENFFCYCPQNRSWYVWIHRWIKQPDDSLIYDTLETILNLLLIYCKEMTFLSKGDENEVKLLEKYEKYIRSIRKHTAMRNIIAVLSMKVMVSLSRFDSDPYLLNTTTDAYDLRTGSILESAMGSNPTLQTNSHMLARNGKPCARWAQFIDEITSHNKEKAAFLQRALGYSLLGVNREECMFVAYGLKSRNGKGTLFHAIETALGDGYFKTVSPMMICEKHNGTSPDFNSPQPMLANLLGARIVSMSEAQQSVRLDAAAMKALTGRDTVTTRGLFEAPFSFEPQFTLWLNTNYLPLINDDTVFLSDRIWVITFDEKFEGAGRDTELKSYLASPAAQPTVLRWLFDGCMEYMRSGLQPPQCVIDATNDYRRQNDRLGWFLDDACEQDPAARTQRGELYQAYRSWCNSRENKFTPVGSTTFYSQLDRRGYGIIKSSGERYVQGVRLK